MALETDLETVDISFRVLKIINWILSDGKILQTKLYTKANTKSRQNDVCGSLLVNFHAQCLWSKFFRTVSKTWVKL